jgi:hypothetical protein
MPYFMRTVINKLSDKYSPTEEELERIRSISDEEIDFSDAPEMDTEFWATAKKISPAKQPEKFAVPRSK